MVYLNHRRGLKSHDDISYVSKTLISLTLLTIVKERECPRTKFVDMLTQKRVYKSEK